MSIGERAFHGSCEYNGPKLTVNIPNSVTTIGEYAFYHWVYGGSITIPSSVTSIASTAFWCEEPWPFTIYGEEGSYAQEFALERNYNFALIGSEAPGTGSKTSETSETPDDSDQGDASTGSSTPAVSASVEDPNGVLPAGAAISAERITSGTAYDNAAAAAKAKIKGLGAFAVLEINLTDASGAQIHELNGKVKVTIPVPENLTVGNGKTIVVYRLEADGTTLTSCETSVANGKITFTTDHFSTYIAANVPASPKTGDTSNHMNVVYLIALMAGIGMVVFVKRKRV